MANGWIEVDKKNAQGPKVLKKVCSSFFVILSFQRVSIETTFMYFVYEGNRNNGRSAGHSQQAQGDELGWRLREVYSGPEEEKTRL